MSTAKPDTCAPRHRAISQRASAASPHACIWQLSTQHQQLTTHACICDTQHKHSCSSEAFHLPGALLAVVHTRATQLALPSDQHPGGILAQRMRTTTMMPQDTSACKRHTPMLQSPCSRAGCGFARVCVCVCAHPTNTCLGVSVRRSTPLPTVSHHRPRSSWKQQQALRSQSRSHHAPPFTHQPPQQQAPLASIWPLNQHPLEVLPQACCCSAAAARHPIQQQLDPADWAVTAPPAMPAAAGQCPASCTTDTAYTCTPVSTLVQYAEAGHACVVGG
jgi:hypothetical protein